MKYTSFLPNGYHTLTRDVENLNEWQIHFENTFVELVVNRFKYKNLPEEIDPRYMELSLLTAGSICFFHDYVKGYCALQGAWSGLDMYYNPVDFHCVTPTGFDPHVTAEDGVIIWNNFTRSSDLPTIWLYSDNIAEIFNTAMVNVRAQKHPVVVLVDSESQRLSLENAYAKLDGNHPVLYLKRTSGIQDAFTTIDAKVPFVSPELFRIGKFMTEEFLKWCGVKVPNSDKKERMITEEQRDLNAVTYQLRNRGLHSRQIGFEKVNKMFGLNVEVEFNEEAMEYYGDQILEQINGIGGLVNE